MSKRLLDLNTSSYELESFPKRTKTSKMGSHSTSSSVKSIERAIHSRVFFRNASKEGEWVRMQEDIMKTVSRFYSISNKELKEKKLEEVISECIETINLTPKGREENLKILLDWGENYYKEDCTVMSHLNKFFKVEHFHTLNRWRGIEDYYDKVEAICSCIEKFRLLCSSYKIVDQEYDCGTCNPFTRNPKGLQLNEGPFWVTERFKLKMNVNGVRFVNLKSPGKCFEMGEGPFSPGEVKINPFIGPTKLSFIKFEGSPQWEREVMSTIGNLEESYRNGKKKGKKSLRKEAEGIVNSSIYGWFSVEFGGELKEFVVNRGNLCSYQSLFEMLDYYSSSDEEARHRGCIENLLKAGNDGFVFAHSLNAFELFERAQDDKQFHYCSLAHIGDIPLIFGSICIDLNEDLGFVFKVFHGSLSGEQKLVAVMAIDLGQRYGLDIEQNLKNAIYLVENNKYTSQSILGLGNSASKKFLTDFAHLSLSNFNRRCYGVTMRAKSGFIGSVDHNYLKGFSITFTGGPKEAIKAPAKKLVVNKEGENFIDAIYRRFKSVKYCSGDRSDLVELMLRRYKTIRNKISNIKSKKSSNVDTADLEMQLAKLSEEIEDAKNSTKNLRDFKEDFGLRVRDLFQSYEEEGSSSDKGKGLEGEKSIKEPEVKERLDLLSMASFIDVRLKRFLISDTGRDLKNCRDSVKLNLKKPPRRKRRGKQKKSGGLKREQRDSRKREVNNVNSFKGIIIAAYQISVGVRFGTKRYKVKNKTVRKIRKCIRSTMADSFEPRETSKLDLRDPEKIFVASKAIQRMLNIQRDYTELIKIRMEEIGWGKYFTSVLEWHDVTKIELSELMSMHSRVLKLN